MKKRVLASALSLMLAFVMCVSVFADAAPRAVDQVNYSAPTTSITLSASTNVKTITTESHNFEVFAKVAPTGAAPSVAWLSTNEDVLSLVNNDGPDTYMEVKVEGAGSANIVAYSLDGLKVATLPIKVTNDRYPVSIGTLQFVKNDRDAKDKFVVEKAVTGAIADAATPYAFKVRVNAQFADASKTTIEVAKMLDELLNVQVSNLAIAFKGFTAEEKDGETATFANFEVASPTKVTGTITLQAKDAKAMKTSLSVTVMPFLAVVGEPVINETNTAITYTFNQAIQAVVTKDGSGKIVTAANFAKNKVLFELMNHPANDGAATAVAEAIKSIAWSASKNTLTVTLKDNTQLKAGEKYSVQVVAGTELTNAGAKVDSYKPMAALKTVMADKLPAAAEDLSIDITPITNSHVALSDANSLKVEGGYVGNFRVLGFASNDAKVNVTIKTGKGASVLPAGTKLTGTTLTVPANAKVGEYTLVLTAKPANAAIRVSKEEVYTLRVTKDYRPDASFIKAEAASDNAKKDAITAAIAAVHDADKPVITYDENIIRVNKDNITDEIKTALQTAFDGKNLVPVQVKMPERNNLVTPVDGYTSKNILMVDLDKLFVANYGTAQKEQLAAKDNMDGQNKDVVFDYYMVVTSAQKASTLTLEPITFAEGAENAAAKNALYTALYSAKATTLKDAEGKDVVIPAGTVKKDTKNNITVNMKNITAPVAAYIKTTLGGNGYDFPLYNVKVENGATSETVVSYDLTGLVGTKAVSKTVALTTGTVRTLPYTIKATMNTSTLTLKQPTIAGEGADAKNELLTKYFKGYSEGEGKAVKRYSAPFVISGTTLKVNGNNISAALKEATATLFNNEVPVDYVINNAFTDDDNAARSFTVDITKLVNGTVKTEIALTGGTVNKLSYAVLTSLTKINIATAEKATATVTGDPAKGATVTATTTTASPDVKYQWQSSNSEKTGYANIAKATEKTFEIPNTAKYKYIRVIVTATHPNYTGSVTSAGVKVLDKMTPAITIDGITDGKLALDMAADKTNGKTLTLAGAQFDATKVTVTIPAATEEAPAVVSLTQGTEANTHVWTVKPLKTGTTTITVAKPAEGIYAAFEQKIEVTVSLGTPEFKFTNPTTTVEIGKTVTNAVTNTNLDPATYESSDITIATVDASGVVTGVKAGKATITAKAAAKDDYMAGEASYEITVTLEKAVAPVALTANDLTVTATSIEIKAPNALNEYAYGAEKTLIVGGKVEGLTPKTSYDVFQRVKETADKAASDWSTAYAVETLDLPAAEFTLNPESQMTLNVIDDTAAGKILTITNTADKGTGAITATLKEGAATDVVTLEKVADSANYTVKPLKAGTTTITVTKAADAGFKATTKEVTVTVENKTATLSFTESTKSIELGTTDYTNTLTNADTLSVAYTSSDEGVATVGTDGKITTLKTGTATITAKGTKAGYNEATATYTLTVTAKEVTTAPHLDKAVVGNDTIKVLVAGGTLIAADLDKVALVVTKDGATLTAETDYTVAVDGSTGWLITLKTAVAADTELYAVKIPAAAFTAQEGHVAATLTLSTVASGD